MESAPGNSPAAQEKVDQMLPWREVFLYFLTLGFINIGGPVAQITMMYNRMVERRHWLSNDRFVRIMAFGHMLPGPSAAVVGLIIVVSLELLPAALLDIPTVVNALIAFLVITVMKVDVAKVALGAMTAGVFHASANGLWSSS